MYRIAVVDDNEAWCFVIDNLFQQEDFIVSTFTDAAAFIREAEQFDIALVDFSIPPRRYQKEMDGPDIIRKLKTSLAKPPFLVLISAFFTEDVLQSADKICPEADAYLSKSMSLQEILHQVKGFAVSKKLGAKLGARSWGLGTRSQEGVGRRAWGVGSRRG
ncbi:response regulator [Leptothermofonsia sp. ETS-13]|uniref:response regulator n=1 Tax=Leptothermofonsia sp. ETS-13 TaxID=3035696 RepID=UPI003BA15736